MNSPHFELNHAIIDELIELLGVGYFELMEEQITQANDYFEELEVLFADGGDPSTIAKRAHALKSSVGQVGLHGIHLLAKETEYKAKADVEAGKPVSAATREAFATLNEFYVPAVQRLRDYAVEKRDSLKS